MGDGELVFDGSIAGHGLLREPLRVSVRDGAVVGAEGEAARWLLDTLDAGGAHGRRLAELGIGTNRAARLNGSLLEDEKVCGTVHVAFGASATIGGVNSATVHIDGVIRAPRLELDGVVVCAGGQLVAAR